MSSTKNILTKFCILLLFHNLATCLIIPEELPTILSLIYSNIPPIKKGTDSRIGVGFRLGEHADFQVLVELGPQTKTDPIGNAASNSKRRRDAMFDAAMRGELGSLAQAIAKYQLERKLQKELEKFNKTKEKVESIESDNKETTASEWLTKWSKEMVSPSEDQASLDSFIGEKDSKSSTGNDKTVQRIGRPPLLNNIKIDNVKIDDLTKLYKLQSSKMNESSKKNN
ncbi:snustorr snarlik [Calliopsis andreniformis]|uniref:snustorr snarlik n=1 Tax=Calliopsis andreniformis TaxID=337506 RepID=UPI003FCDB6B8